MYNVYIDILLYLVYQYINILYQKRQYENILNV